MLFSASRFFESELPEHAGAGECERDSTTSCLNMVIASPFRAGVQPLGARESLWREGLAFATPGVEVGKCGEECTPGRSVRFRSGPPRKAGLLRRSRR